MAAVTVVGTTKNVFKQAELSELTPEEITKRDKAELERVDRQREISRKAAAKELAEFDPESILRAAKEARAAAEKALFEHEFSRLQREIEVARAKENHAAMIVESTRHRLRKTIVRSLNVETAAALERYRLLCSRAMSQWQRQYGQASNQAQAEKGLALRERLYSITAGFGELAFEFDPLKVVEEKTRQLQQLGFNIEG